MLRRHPLAVALVALAPLGLVAGCSTSTAAHPAPSRSQGIASLATASPDAKDPNDALFAKYGTPGRFRLDMSPADVDRVMEPMNRCLEDAMKAAQATSPPTADGASTAKEAAGQACQALLPESAWEYDRNNPDAQRFIEAVVDCMRSNGLSGAKVATDSRGDYFPSGPGSDFDAVQKRCETSTPKS